MRVRFFALAVGILGILLGCANSAFAQAGAASAQLSGTVLDESGGSVGKASITLRELDTNRTYATSANDSGFYVLPNLPPGRYELKASYTGFANYTQTGIVLTVGQTATINVTLKVKSVGEQVVVTSEAPVIEPTKTEISQVIDTKQISSLPISGRLFTDFALLTPGVATGRTSLQSTITEFEVTRISFAGMRDLSNEVTVDGADNINTATGSQRSTPPQEAVEEFRVVNNSFGAEYGRALGGIVNIVTKSGTNDLHGSVYDYLQNNAVDARSLLQPSPDPYVLRQNQFGGTLGGPIKKDKTFFFMNYEGQRRGESPTFPGVLVNDLAEINAAKAILGIAPENLNILKTKDNDYGIIKVDHQLNANNRLSFRYNIEDGRDLNQLVGSTLDGGGIGAPSSGHNLLLRDQSLVGTWTSEIRPNLVNSFLVQYARRHYFFPGVTGEPNLDIPNDLLFGHNFGVLDAIYESRVQVSDSVAWVKGAHVAKFGVDTNYVNNFVIWPGFTPMRIIMPGLNCLADFANFVAAQEGVPGGINFADQGPCPLDLNGNAVQHGVPIVFWGAPVGPGPTPNGFVPPPIVPNTCQPVTTCTNWPAAYLSSQTHNFSETLDHSYYGFFAQDQWRATPKLTVNYGLRWDFEAGLSKQINPHYNGFQPRVGLAYSPNSKTVIRAGFGLFDDRYNLSFLFITQPQQPAIIPGQTVNGVRKGAESATWILNQLPTINPLAPTPNCTAANTFFAPCSALTLITTGQVPPEITNGPPGSLVPAGDGLVDPRSKIPYSEQANLEIDRELGGGFSIGAGYLWVAAHHLVRAENLNVCPPGVAANQTVPEVTPGTTTCPPPAPLPPFPNWPAGKAYFSGPAYTNAGLLYFTDNSGNSVYHGLTLQGTYRYRSNFRLSANYTFSHTIDDGTFTTFVSTPQDLYNRSLERANSNQDVRQRFSANFVADGPKNTILRNFEFSSIITLQTPRPFTMFVGFDANGDTNPVTDRVGNEGRNTYLGDYLRTWDLRLSYHFDFREHMRLELGLDGFNVLNRPNLDEVTSVYGTYNFCGAVPKQYKDAASVALQTSNPVATCLANGVVVPANPGFGTPRVMLNPRQLQGSIKYSF